MCLTKFVIIKNAFSLSDFLHKSDQDLLLQSTPEHHQKQTAHMSTMGMCETWGTSGLEGKTVLCF